MNQNTITKQRRSRRLGLLSLALLLGLAPGGCIIVESDGCAEGTLVCNGEYIEECVADEWLIVEDCYDFCHGTCVYIDGDVPACAC
jgi:hypothetical protein